MLTQRRLRKSYSISSRYRASCRKFKVRKGSAMSDSDDGTVIDRMFAALAAGDLPAVRTCYTADAVVWHGFDGVALDLGGICAQWQGLIDAFSERVVVDVRRQPTPTGFVQQHVMVCGREGLRKAWPVCIVVRIEAGLIARLDEYIDRAGAFTPLESGAVPTPGMPAA